MKRLVFLFVLMSLLVACTGTAQTPVLTVDVNATIAALSGTMMAGTLTAQPTHTPTATATFTPEPTATFTPEPTATLTLEPTATWTPIPFFGTLDPLGAGGNVKTGLFRIENNSGEPEIIVTLNGSTLEGNPRPIYMAYKVTTVFLFDIPWGKYNYVVQIGSKKMHTGQFTINNYDKTTMRVTLQKVVIVGP